MPKAVRVQHITLKPGKELYRKGDFFAAIGFFKRERTRLIRELRTPQAKSQRQKTKMHLALVNHQLSLCTEAAGNERMADKYSLQAIKYYEGPNHLGFAILIRDDGMRMLGRNRLLEAEQLACQALAIIQRLSENSEHVPESRLTLEHWVTQSHVGQVLIAKGDKRKGLALLRAADAHLREGSKRYRELNNLMALIPHVGLVEQRVLAARAFLLNEQHVHNPFTRAWLGSVLIGGGTLGRLVKPFLR